MAWRNVTRQYARTATALGAVSLGVAAIVIAGGFVHDVYEQFGEAIIHSQYGHIQIYRKGYAAKGTQRPLDYLIDPRAPMLNRVKQFEGVVSVLARLRFVGTASAGGADLPIVAEGVQPDLENRLGTFVHLLEGRLLRAGERETVIVGDGLAKALRVHPGMVLTLNVVSREGALNSLEFVTVGIFRSHSKEFDARAVRLPIESARDLLGSSGQNEIVVELRDTRATEITAAEALAALGPEDYEVRTWRELADFYGKTIQLFDRQFGFLQGLLLLLIALSVSSTINASTFERLPEFGTMIALGDTRRDVSQLIVTECVILGILGSVIGVCAGIALALSISAIGIEMPPPPNTEVGYVARIQIVPVVLLAGVFVGSVAATLGGLAPAMKIARTSPVEALGRAL